MRRTGLDRLNWRRIAALSIVGTMALVLTGSEASAWRGAYYGYGYAGHAPYSVYYGGYSSYGWHGSYAVSPYYRTVGWRHARRAHRAYYRGAWGYCGSGCYSTCCAPVACCNTCYSNPCGCGSYVTHYRPSTTCCGADGGTVIEDAPTQSGDVQPTPVEPTPAEPESGDDTSTSIDMVLPPTAKVYVNDRATSSVGSQRSFVSRGLQPGYQYAYHVRVEYERDGKPTVQQRHIKLKAGDRIALDFRASQTDASRIAESPEQDRAQAAETKVTLHVPAGAEVFLAGVPTTQQGSKRQYLTTRLTQGELWKDYTIRVVMQKDGNSLTREKTVQVHGGQSYELTFDFDQQGPKLAMNTP